MPRLIYDSLSNDAGNFGFVLESEGRLHAQEVRDRVKIIRFAVLLADLLFDELVPIIARERSFKMQNIMKNSNIKIFKKLVQYTIL